MSTGDGDKRKVTTDALETLGTIISENEKRDAIHLAVENVVAQEKLFPGQDVGPDGTTAAPVGIVDPFLKAPVFPGQRFWLVVYPRQIHSLRHVWTHPAFVDPPETAADTSPPKDDKARSEAWLRAWCSTADCPGYEIVIGEIAGMETSSKQWNPEEYLHFDGLDAHGEIPKEFWHHAEVVLGRKLKHHPSSLSCSC